LLGAWKKAFYLSKDFAIIVIDSSKLEKLSKLCLISLIIDVHIRNAIINKILELELFSNLDI
jgi:hypothetical protein